MSLSLQNTGRFCSYYKQECFHPYIVKEVKTFDLSIYFSCPVGHYCPAGSVEPIRCENGTYQDQTTQWTCKTCPAGYFCDNTVDIVILDNSTTVCPMGTYCPEGTRYSNEFKCPIGTFNNRTGKHVLWLIPTAGLGFRFRLGFGFQTLWLHSIVQNMFPLAQIQIRIPFP